jgi:hypothetical protein
MSFKVYSSSPFEKELKGLKKKYPSLATDLKKLVAILKNDPFTGAALGKNCYKIRMAITSKGRGKSGGARVITCVKIIQEHVFLLSIYDKSTKEALDDNELILLLEATGLL